MRMMQLSSVLAVLGALLVSSSAWAAPLAWPIQPPEKAFISGPGLTGQVEITDPSILEVLRLGGIEDFSQGPVPTPDLAGEGYTITRYFYGGSFNFGVLHYYPGADGKPSYVYFEDGPDFQGDHTEYDRMWFNTIPEGDIAMKTLLKSLEVSQSHAALSPFIWRYLLLGTAVLAVGAIIAFGARRG